MTRIGSAEVAAFAAVEVEDAERGEA